MARFVDKKDNLDWDLYSDSVSGSDSDCGSGSGSDSNSDYDDAAAGAGRWYQPCPKGSFKEVMNHILKQTNKILIPILTDTDSFWHQCTQYAKLKQ